MTREYVQRRRVSQARIRDERRRRITVIDDDYGTMLVTRKNRRVRITVITKPGMHTGKITQAPLGWVDLGDDQVDRLIQRLQAIRGGKRALP